MSPLPLTTAFDDLPGLRRDAEDKLRSPTGILVIATCTVIARAGSWEAIVGYGRPHRGGLLSPLLGAGERHPRPRHLRSRLRQGVRARAVG